MRSVTTCCSVPDAQESSPTVNGIVVSRGKGLGWFCPSVPRLRAVSDCRWAAGGPDVLDCPNAAGGRSAHRTSTRADAAQWCTIDSPLERNRTKANSCSRWRVTYLPARRTALYAKLEHSAVTVNARCADQSIRKVTCRAMIVPTRHG